MLIRRDLLGAFAAYALLGELGLARAGDRSRSIRSWLDRHEWLATSLAAGDLAPEQWRREVEALGREADVERLIAEALPSPSSQPFPTHPARRLLHYRDAEGRPRMQRFGVALFEFERKSVITPHAHRGVLSAHLVARGALRVRTYDRIADEPKALVLRPATDRRIERGEVSTIGPARDNVHWFVPATERAATLDVLVEGLDPSGPEYLLQPVDPLGGTELADGTLRAPLLSFEESARRYARG
jgi:hypothetical protein